MRQCSELGSSQTRIFLELLLLQGGMNSSSTALLADGAAPQEESYGQFFTLLLLPWCPSASHKIQNSFSLIPAECRQPWPL